jgi:hypothetical protein
MWWSQWPSANVGIATGASSGLVVLDIDPGHGGTDGMRELITRHGSPPRTVVVETGGGGRHGYFGCNGKREFKSTTNLAGLSGIDVRGEGGFVVAPPSLHASGELYAFAAGAGVDDTSMADAPRWLAESRRTSASAEPVGDTIPEGQRETALCSLAGTLRRKGLAASEIEASLTAVNESRCSPPIDPMDVARIATSVGRYEPAERLAPATDRPQRPEIRITTEIHEVNDHAIEALRREANLYQRGGALGQVVCEAAPRSTVCRPPGAPTIARVEQARLLELLHKHALWTKYNKRAREWIPSAPPRGCAEMILARGQWSTIRPLEGIVSAPVLRPDGSVLDAPGYDESTGLLYVGQPLDVSIPLAPSRSDAAASAERLLDVVSDFPFGGPEHRSAWLSAVLTPFARFAFRGPAPMFLVEANRAGAGKTQLANLVSIISQGQAAAAMPYGQGDDDELRKKLTTIALAGDRVVLIDNIVGLFGGASLEAALTSPDCMWHDRKLGSNTSVRLPLLTTWLATANNVQLAGDIYRRIVHIRLETQLEHPEERTDFKRPLLLDWTREAQPELAAAALTILRGYTTAGQPRAGLTPWGSFDGWSNLVREAIVWSGQPDPGLTRQRLREDSDTDSHGLRALLSGMLELDQLDRGLTAQDMIRACETNARSHQELRAALDEYAAPRGGSYSARSLGRRLAAFRRRVVDGQYLDRMATDRTKTIRWCVRTTT